jgi:hypothetical protein
MKQNGNIEFHCNLPTTYKRSTNGPVAGIDVLPLDDSYSLNDNTMTIKQSTCIHCNNIDL